MLIQLAGKKFVEPPTKTKKKEGKKGNNINSLYRTHLYMLSCMEPKKINTRERERDKEMVHLQQTRHQLLGER